MLDMVINGQGYKWVVYNGPIMGTKQDYPMGLQIFISCISYPLLLTPRVVKTLSGWNSVTCSSNFPQISSSFFSLLGFIHFTAKIMFNPTSNLQNSMHPSVPSLIFEKDVIARKLKEVEMERNILEKQSQQREKDYGELLLRFHDTEYKLNEYEILKLNLATAEQEVERLKNHFNGKVRVLSDEVKMLKQHNSNLAEGNGVLEASQSRIEEELKNVKLNCEKLEMENKRLKKEMEETKKRDNKLLSQLSEAEKYTAENSRLLRENRKLEKDYSALKGAATDRYRILEKRLSELERSVAILNEIASSGSQLIQPTEVIQEQESFGAEENLKDLLEANQGMRRQHRMKRGRLRQCQVQTWSVLLISRGSQRVLSLTQGLPGLLHSGQTHLLKRNRLPLRHLCHQQHIPLLT